MSALPATLLLLAAGVFSIQAANGLNTDPLAATPATQAVTPDASAAAEQATMAPAGTTRGLVVSAKGIQIYRCEAVTGGASQWTFVAPQADLFEAKGISTTPQGTHGAGPVWRWNDGSALLGTVVAKSASPEAGAVPWLLLSTKPAPESTDGGRLQKFTYVRRTDTHGGAAPAGGCTVSAAGQLLKVPYTATYSFYLGGS